MFNIIPLRKVWNERRVTKIIGSKKDIFKTKNWIMKPFEKLYLKMHLDHFVLVFIIALI